MHPCLGFIKSHLLVLETERGEVSYDLLIRCRGGGGVVPNLIATGVWGFFFCILSDSLI